MSLESEGEFMVAIEGACEPRFSRVRDAFAAAFSRNREVGAAIAFMVDGEMVVDLWAGHLAADKKRPWTRDTIANTYSTTKGMTATCIHVLVERGRIDLDAPVADYWPEFAAAGKSRIPVRWLLTHQAGLPAIREPLPGETLYDWDAMTEALAAEAPWWEPGTRHGYHPVTFGFLVGEVIRRVSGRSVGAFFREEIAEPLDADFQIGLPAEEDARVADMIGGLVPPRSTGPDSKVRLKGPLAQFVTEMADPTTMVGAAFNNPKLPPNAVNTRAWRGAEIPAANGHGSARALARVYGALARGGELGGVRILQEETIRRARSEQVAGPDATLASMPMRYGLGFMLRSDFMPFSPHPDAFGHPGAGGSIGMADPETRTGFGFVMNKMSMGLVGGPTGFAVLKAFFETLRG